MNEEDKELLAGSAFIGMLGFALALGCGLFYIGFEGNFSNVDSYIRLVVIASGIGIIGAVMGIFAIASYSNEVEKKSSEADKN